MSSIVNKVKDALHSDKDNTHHHEGTHSSTHPTSHTGTHTTTGAADPRTHSNIGSSTTTAGAHDTTLGGSDNYTYGTGANRGASGPATRTDGPHESNLMNKADPRVDSDRDHSRNMGMNPQGTATTGTTGTTTGAGIVGAGRTTGSTRTDGPHDSNLMNKADPRIDSDRDHSRNMGMNPQGTATTGTTGGYSGGLGSSGTTTGAGVGTTDSNRGSGGPATRTDGPHGSNLMNKADPRVDSDRDHSRNMGANPHGTATTGTTGTMGGFGSTGTTGTHSGTMGTSTLGNNGAFGGQGGTTASSGLNRGAGGPATRTDGPHGSNLMNKADPRVDSDRDYSRNMGANPHGTAATTATTGAMGGHGLGTTGTTGTTGTHGTHGLGTTGTTGTHGTHGLAGATGSGPGPAPSTAGPHKSDMMNKADPRVDSDLDGSKTLGGNKTSESMAYKDPTDAAQVPPSVLQKHVGAPSLEHDDHSHDRAKRHSISHQEQHRGL